MLLMRARLAPPDTRLLVLTALSLSQYVLGYGGGLLASDQLVIECTVDTGAIAVRVQHCMRLLPARASS